MTDLEWKRKEAVQNYIKAEKELKEVFNLKTNNIVGEIGELKTIEFLSKDRNFDDIRLTHTNEKGFDAIDANNNRYQIKTRVKYDERVLVKSGYFKLEPDTREISHLFDFLLFCVLDSHYEIIGLYELTFEQVLKYYKSDKEGRKWIVLTRKIKTLANNLLNKKMLNF